MPIRPPEFDRVGSLLEPFFRDLPPIVVAITGAMGAGKTTLGRFLAWYFNVTLVETDHYLKSQRRSTYETAEVERIVTSRLNIPRPVIVEGVAVVPLLAALKLQPAFILQVRNRNALSSNRKRLPKQRDPSLHGFQVPTALVEVSH